MSIIGTTIFKNMSSHFQRKVLISASVCKVLNMQCNMTVEQDPLVQQLEKKEQGVECLEEERA